MTCVFVQLRCDPGKTYDVADASLRAAVKAAGLDGTLDTGGPFTVFAPTDDAFGNLPAGTVEGLLDDLDALTDILLFHVVEGRVFANDLSCGTRVKMVNGDFSLTKCVHGNVFQRGPGNTQLKPKIVDVDIEACNGVVHVVNNVLLP